MDDLIVNSEITIEDFLIKEISAITNPDRQNGEQANSSRITDCIKVAKVLQSLKDVVGMCLESKIVQKQEIESLNKEDKNGQFLGFSRQKVLIESLFLLFCVFSPFVCF